VLFAVDAPPVDLTEVNEAAGDEHGLVAIEGSLFTARVDPGTGARPNTPLQLALDPTRIHYFDPVSGLRLEPVPVLAGAVER
jgi:multiple sugar transport system ATP-binding protein